MQVIDDKKVGLLLENYWGSTSSLLTHFENIDKNLKPQLHTFLWEVTGESARDVLNTRILSSIVTHHQEIICKQYLSRLKRFKSHRYNINEYLKPLLQAQLLIFSQDVERNLPVVEAKQSKHRRSKSQLSQSVSAQLSNNKKLNLVKEFINHYYHTTSFRMSYRQLIFGLLPPRLIKFFRGVILNLVEVRVLGRLRFAVEGTRELLRWREYNIWQVRTVCKHYFANLVRLRTPYQNLTNSLRPALLNQLDVMLDTLRKSVATQSLYVPAECSYSHWDCLCCSHRNNMIVTSSETSLESPTAKRRCEVCNQEQLKLNFGESNPTSAEANLSPNLNGPITTKLCEVCLCVNPADQTHCLACASLTSPDKTVVASEVSETSCWSHVTLVSRAQSFHGSLTVLPGQAVVFHGRCFKEDHTELWEIPSSPNVDIDSPSSQLSADPTKPTSYPSASTATSSLDETVEKIEEGISDTSQPPVLPDLQTTGPDVVVRIAWDRIKEVWPRSFCHRQSALEIFVSSVQTPDVKTTTTTTTTATLPFPEASPFHEDTKHPSTSTSTSTIDSSPSRFSQQLAAASAYLFTFTCLRGPLLPEGDLERRDQLLTSLCQRLGFSTTLSLQARFSESDIPALWRGGQLSNLEYLLWLNKAAGRSFNDLNQYPVMPWVIADYTSESFDLGDISRYRDLSKPVGALLPGQAELAKTRFQEMAESPDLPPFHHGSHYSNAGNVLHYLVRHPDFTQLHKDMNDGRFDLPDRLFLSVEKCWQLSQQNDNKEITPEWFDVQQGTQMLENLQRLDLGQRQGSNGTVDHVALPPWARTPRDFITVNRMALESDHVSANLHHWIDLVFGAKQRGKAAEEAMNVFFYLTYDGTDSLDLAKIKDESLRLATINQIQHFGQTPCQLLTSPHLAKET